MASPHVFGRVANFGSKWEKMRMRRGPYSKSLLEEDDKLTMETTSSCCTGGNGSNSNGSTLPPLQK